jgi:hypothetical protein
LGNILANGQEIVASNMRGRRVQAGETVATGRLPAEIAEHLREQLTLCQVDYLIFSYATPVAWRYADGKWRVPNVRYSQTTSKQMGRVRTGLSALS